MTPQEAMMDQVRKYEQEIRETCAIAGVPEKAQAFINRSATPSQVRTELLANRAGSGFLVEDMKRKHGITD